MAFQGGLGLVFGEPGPQLASGAPLTGQVLPGKWRTLADRGGRPLIRDASSHLKKKLNREDSIKVRGL